MIKIQNLSFSYGTNEILCGVDMTVPKGGVTMLLGRNGAGKTTLFRCILGLSEAYGGSIIIAGKNAQTLSPKQTARHIAYIPQVHYPAFNYSVLDMVLMGTGRQVYAFSTPKAAQYKAAERALDRVGISDLAPRDYCGISGGEQQLTLIARALAQETPILLMDEPTASLDYGNQIMVMEQVRLLADKGFTILMSCHNPQHALSYATKVVALQDGRVLASGSPDTVLTSELIFRLYGVKAELKCVENDKVLLPMKNKKGFYL